MVQKIVAFDVLGPGYHYDSPNGWKMEDGALKTFLDTMARLGYKAKDLAEEAWVEETMLRKGEIIATATPYFVESVLATQREGALPIIISAGTEGTFELTLEEASRDYQNRTGERVSPNQLFPREHRHSTITIGSKKKPETWNTVQERYDNAPVVATYEDTFTNLQAAMKGMNCDGYHVIAQNNGLVTIEKRLIRGSMEELLPTLVERLRA